MPTQHSLIRSPLLSLAALLLIAWLASYSCVPPVTLTEEQEKAIREGLGASSSRTTWELKTSYDKMTGESLRRAASPLIASENGEGISFITVFCGELLADNKTNCIIGFMFPLRALSGSGYNAHRWGGNKLVTLRVRFDSEQTKRVVFLPVYIGQEMLVVAPNNAAGFTNDFSKASVLRLELTWKSRGGIFSRYYNYPLDAAWKTIKRLHPKISPRMFENKMPPEELDLQRLDLKFWEGGNEI